MMELNQAVLRGILAEILSVDENFIVPKQGNWWNPQENDGKPDTWCAYIIRQTKPCTTVFYVQSKDGKTNYAAVQKISIIDLQFVGVQAEDVAQSIAFWPLRDDVRKAFSKIGGSIMNSAMEVQSSIFYQDGLNTVTAWNVTIKILWYHKIDTKQEKMPTVFLHGRIIK